MRKLLIAFAVLILGVLFFSGYIWYLLTDRVEGRYFDSNGVQIHYTDEGEGEPVILVHGFATQADVNWRMPGTTAELCNNYRVIMLDNRGAGLSGKPHESKAYGEEMCMDIIRLMDHLDIEKAHLAGYSLGGFIALKLAAMHPERFYDVAAMGAGWEDPNNSKIMDQMETMARDLRAGKAIGPPGGDIDDGRQKPSFMHRAWAKVMTGWFNDKMALAATLEAAPELGIPREDLPNINIPVLTVVGTEDPLMIGVENMKGKLKDHQIIFVEGADHIEAVRTDALREALISFLKKKHHAEPAAAADM